MSEQTGLVVSFDETSLQEYGTQLQKFIRFVKSQLTINVDYGKIIKGGKPSLFKSGAEKIGRLHGIGSKIIEKKTEINHETGFVYANYVIETNQIRTGLAIHQCEGSANSFEKEQWEKNPFEYINTIQKIAQKRAFIGAVIMSIGGASEFFTQDLEDNPKAFTKQTTNINPQTQSPPDPKHQAINYLWAVLKQCNLADDPQERSNCLLNHFGTDKSSVISNLTVQEIRDKAEIIKKLHESKLQWQPPKEAPDLPSQSPLPI